MAPSLVSLLFALRLGSFGAHVEAPPTPAVREDARAIAAENELSPAVLLDRSQLRAVPLAPKEAPAGSGALVAHTDRPEEWVSVMAHELKLENQRVGRAAIWLATAPVRVDVDGHFGLALRLRNF
jgi:hypothetical protein